MLKQKTVYFREEDLPLWDLIPNKAEWLHEKLADVDEKIQMGDFTGPLNIIPPLVVQASAAFEGKTCKNGHPSPDGKKCFKMKCVYS